MHKQIYTWFNPYLLSSNGYDYGWIIYKHNFHTTQSTIMHDKWHMGYETDMYQKREGKVRSRNSYKITKQEWDI